MALRLEENQKNVVSGSQDKKVLQEAGTEPLGQMLLIEVFSSKDIIDDFDQFTAVQRGKCPNGSSKGGEKLEAINIGSSLEFSFKGKE